jgi:hypothetical protein
LFAGNALLVMTAVTVAPREAESQTVPRRCQSAPEYAVGAPSLWPDQHERIPKDTVAVGFVRLAERLQGTYDLLEVTTEGDSGRFMIRSVLELRVRRSQPSPRVQGILEGYLTGIDQGFITEAPQLPTPDTRRRYIRGYYRLPDVLSFEWMDSTRSDSVISFNEGATIYTVTAIDSAGTVRGRWTSGGGYLLRPLPTWAGELLESVGGYFCAWRRS